MTPGRLGRLLPVAALLLVTGCEETAQERAQRLLIAKARERNAVVGYAVTLLLLLSYRLVRAALTASRPAPRAGHAPRRLPAVLVVAAVASEVVVLLVLGMLGATVAYFAGPTPFPEVGSDSLGMGLLAIFFAVPFGSLALVIALLLAGLPERLPDVRTATYVVVTLVHVLVVAIAAATAADGAQGHWLTLCAVFVAAGTAAALGYGYATVMRIRWARAARAARGASPV